MKKILLIALSLASVACAHVREQYPHAELIAKKHEAERIFAVSYFGDEIFYDTGEFYIGQHYFTDDEDFILFFCEWSPYIETYRCFPVFVDRETFDSFSIGDNIGKLEEYENGDPLAEGWWGY